MTENFPLTQQPLAMRGVTINNRLVRAGQGTKLAEGEVDDRLLNFHLARARGGIGLTIVQDAGVHHTSPGMFQLYERGFIPGYRRLVETCRDAGMEVFQELSHPGSISRNPVSASAVPSPITGEPSHALSVAEVHEIIEGHAVSARHCVEAGMRGLEVLAGHGYLVDQFLSPRTNLRDDEYGGSLTNRQRFLTEILEAIREAVGGDVVVGVRLSTAEGVPTGYDESDTIELVKRLEDADLVDFVDLTFGSVAMDDMMGPTSFDHGYQLPMSRRVSASTTVPTMVTGRITSVAQAEQILAAGDADMVSLVRASLADPDIAAKSWAGRAHDVRPCDGCNFCLESMTRQKNLRCSVNPFVGQEERKVVPAEESRSVVVVGAGPAGLETARLAASAGHRVTVLEREQVVGGAARLGGLAPRHRDFGRYVDWLEDQLVGLGVELHTGVEATADVVAGHSPDLVVVATGARTADVLEHLDGSGSTERPAVVDGRAVMLGARPEAEGAPVVVLDELGTYEALGPLELLASEGYDVTVVTSGRKVAAALGASCQQAPALSRLRALEVEMVTETIACGLTPTGVQVQGIEGDDQREIPADLVVNVTGLRPDESVADELTSAVAGARVVLIGDAREPRNQAAAVEDALDAVLAL